MTWRRSRRVRVHLEENGTTELPTVDGLLVSRRRREYVIGVPQLTFAAGAEPITPEGRFVVLPRERVAFYELL